MNMNLSVPILPQTYHQMECKFEMKLLWERCSFTKYIFVCLLQSIPWIQRHFVENDWYGDKHDQQALCTSKYANPIETFTGDY